MVAEWWLFYWISRFGSALPLPFTIDFCLLFAVLCMLRVWLKSVVIAEECLINWRKEQWYDEFILSANDSRTGKARRNFAWIEDTGNPKGVPLIWVMESTLLHKRGPNRRD